MVFKKCVYINPIPFFSLFAYFSLMFSQMIMQALNRNRCHDLTLLLCLGCSCTSFYFVLCFHTLYFDLLS